MISAVEVIAALLGVFEFIAALRILTLNERELVDEMTLFPVQFLVDPATKALLATFLIFLGLLRLQWSVTVHSMASWVFLVLTHVVEGCMFWRLAYLPHFNTKNLNLQELIADIISLSYGRMETFILLLVPFLVLLFLVAGPHLPSTGQRASKKAQ